MKRSLELDREDYHNISKHRKNARKKDEWSYLSSKPWMKFDLKFPHFRKPIEMGCFSIDERKSFSNSRDQMKFFVPPPNPNKVNFNLRLGYAAFIKKEEDPPALLNNLLKWIQHNSSLFRLHTEAIDHLQRHRHLL